MPVLNSLLDPSSSLFVAFFIGVPRQDCLAGHFSNGRTNVSSEGRALAISFLFLRAFPIQGRKEETIDSI